MFFILSKTIGLLTRPFSCLVILMLITIFVRKPKLKKSALIAAMAVLLIFSNPWILNFSLRKWEPAPRHVNSLHQAYDFGIVLGGFAAYLPKYQRIQLTDAGDRLWQTISLYKEGKIKKILISGGGGKGTKPEADAVKESLLLFGIPDSDILVENTSRNTHENLKNSAELIASVQPGARCLLITSALHIPRSIRCAQKNGLTVDAWPVEHLGRHSSRFWAEWLAPKPDALYNWDRLINEWVGILAYKVQGYI